MVDVELALEAAEEGPEHVDLTMAAWSPGSYLIRDYARFVREVRATADGQPLSVRKQDKQTWRIETKGARQVKVDYSVYGRDLTVRTNHIDHSHAFLHGPATYLVVEGARGLPQRVRVTPPAGRDWPVITGLPVEARADGEDGEEQYRARDVDQMLDCPLHVGPVEVRTMEVLATPVRLAVWGEIAPGRAGDLDRLCRDLAAILEVHGNRLGGRIPCEQYTFILMLSPGSYGGLEHKNSSANLHSSFCMESSKSYLGLLELLSHEFFHVWNGKRIFPPAHAHFDYSQEAYTRCLWVMEGLTSYYDRYALVRAGCMEPKKYLEKLAEEWSRFRSIPGRAVHSLEDASFDAWIKLYKPHESNVNTTVSYYLEGGLAALVLDLQIREATGGERCLDQILEALWRDYGEKVLPYPEELQALFEEAAGIPLGDFFEHVVRGPTDPDLATALACVGLRLQETNASEGEEESSCATWLGIVLEGTRVAQVLDGSPAARAGLSPGDLLLAWDGWQVKNESDLRKRLGGRAAGERGELTLFRRRRLHQVVVELGEAPPKRVQIVGIEEPSTGQSELYQAWLGQEHPGSKLSASASGARWV